MKIILWLEFIANAFFSIGIFTSWFYLINLVAMILLSIVLVQIYFGKEKTSAQNFENETPKAYLWAGEDS